MEVKEIFVTLENIHQIYLWFIEEFQHEISEHSQFSFHKRRDIEVLPNL